MATPKRQILFQIHSIKLNSFYLKNIDDFKPENPVHIQVTLNFGVNKEKAVVGVNIKVDFSQNNKEMMGIEVTHNFKFKDPTILEGCTQEKFNLPKELLKSLVSISISGTRGMHAGLNANSPYSKIYIPLINPSKLIQEPSS